MEENPLCSEIDMCLLVPCPQHFKLAIPSLQEDNMAKQIKEYLLKMRNQVAKEPLMSS